MIEQLIKEHIYLVWNIARIIAQYNQRIEIGDLITPGYIALKKCAAEFEPDRGYKFRSFAQYRIRGAMIDEIRKICGIPRTQHAAGKRATDFDENDFCSTITEYEHIRRCAFEKLSDRERSVVRLIYFESNNFDEVSRLYNVSASRVSQIHKDAITKLRKALKKDIEICEG